MKMGPEMQGLVGWPCVVAHMCRVVLPGAGLSVVIIVSSMLTGPTTEGRASVPVLQQAQLAMSVPLASPTGSGESGLTEVGLLALYVKSLRRVPCALPVLPVRPASR
jgi:hypothetical protein